MSKRANRVLIGGFTIGAIFVVIAAILIFGSGRLFKEKVRYVLFFNGSIKGLSIGAPVDFKGTPIGQVSDITLLMDPVKLRFYNRVVVEITPGKIVELGSKGSDVTLSPEEDYQLARLLVRRGLRAKLDMTSFLTGKLQVSFDFFPETKANMTGIKSDYKELPTLPSDMEELTRKLGDIPITELVDEALMAISDVRTLLRSPQIQSALTNLDTSIAEISTLIKNLDTQIKPLLEDLNGAINDYGKLARSLDRQIGPVMTELRGTLQDARGLVNNLNQRIDPLAGEAETTLKAATATFQSYGNLVEDDSALMYSLNETLTELATAARSLRALADYLERNPESLLKGKQ
jgi:paraquat-inducible protein B